MFITEDQARERLSSPENLANRFNIGAARAKREESLHAENESQEKEQQPLSTGIEHRELKRAGQRRSWLSSEERTEVAIAAKIGQQTQQEIAQEHGISQIAVAKIKAGNGLVDETSVETALEQARSKALDRLMTSLGLLTDDKISGASAKDISVIASNMARVVEKTMPDRERQGNINLVIYAPELRNEKSFDIVEI
jgi:hypothetical protein